MAEKQTSYSIAEYVDLPSSGKIYDTPVNSEIKLRAMTGRDELKRSGGKNSLNVLADVIEDCMIEKPAVHVYDMAIGDYEYLLHRLRVITHGTKYKMVVWCPHCKHYQEAVANLDQIQVRAYEEEEWNQAKYLKLPDSGDLITLKFQTPRMVDEQKVKVKDMSRRFKGVQLDFSKLVLVKSVIAEVNNQLMDEMKLEDYVMGLTARDMNLIIQGVDKLNACIGIEADLIVDCPNPDCGEEIKTRFQYGQEFIEPTIY